MKKIVTTASFKKTHDADTIRSYSIRSGLSKDLSAATAGVRNYNVVGLFHLLLERFVCQLTGVVLFVGFDSDDTN